MSVAIEKAIASSVTQAFPVDRKLFTVPEAAKLVGLSRSKLYSMVRDGSLRSVRFGKAWRIPQAALAELLQKIA